MARVADGPVIEGGTNQGKGGSSQVFAVRMLPYTNKKNTRGRCCLGEMSSIWDVLSLKLL